jgi:hypothetical protein
VAVKKSVDGIEETAPRHSASVQSCGDGEINRGENDLSCGENGSASAAFLDW